MRQAPLLPVLPDRESQAAFRALLAALSRPGIPVTLPGDVVEPAVPPSISVALALVDVEVRVCVIDDVDDVDWAGALASVAGCMVGPLEEAQMTIALRAPTPDELRALSRGRADAPELGSRLLLACEQVGRLGGGEDPEQGAVVLTITGPGVDGAVRIGVGGLPVEVFETLEALNREFPMGIDTFMVASNGVVVGLPRSTRLVIERGASAWATPR